MYDLYEKMNDLKAYVPFKAISGHV